MEAAETATERAGRGRTHPAVGYLLALVCWCLLPLAGSAAPGPAIDDAPADTQAMTQCLAGPGWTRGDIGFVRGINLAGGEFNPDRLPGQYGKDYRYPSEAQLEYYSKNGFDVVRLPFLWERLQPRMFGALDDEEVRRVLSVIEKARQHGMRVILDPHNYARYRVDGKAHVIGSAAVPVGAFIDFWRRLAHVVSGIPGIYALSLMNEPHDTGKLWRSVAQEAVDAIRGEDRVHLILAPGDHWSGAWSWRKYNDDFLLRDPADKLVYEAHQYFDPDRSGAYRDDRAPAPETDYVELVRPFVSWLKLHHVRGVITEAGVPSRRPAWFDQFDRLLTWLSANQIAWVYWAGGYWPANYVLSSEPKGDVDAPIMRILTRCRPS
jgi:endoglucanase